MGRISAEGSGASLAKKQRCLRTDHHPMAFFARLGIFLPPFMVAAFTIFIKPYPEKHHYREMVEDTEALSYAGDGGMDGGGGRWGY